MPALKVRGRANSVDGGVSPQDLVMIPIYTFVSDNNRDFDDCPYADAQNADYWHNRPEIFNDLSD
jgi:hypothetical protein